MSLIERSDQIFNTVKVDELVKFIDYRVARTKKELDDVYSLVYREYLKRGYVKETPSGMKLSVYNALPQAVTFVAVSNNEIFATATLVPDSPLGLPMDAIYNEELKWFRSNDKTICEITMLASNTSLFQSGVSMMLNAKKMFLIFFLFKLVYDYARYVLCLDYICITINPKHNLTYDFLMFNDLGELKYYENANGAPAIAKYLDLIGAEEKCRQMNREGLYKMFFAKSTPMEQFTGKYEMSEKDIRYFFEERTDTFQTATSNQIAYLKSFYPEYNFPYISS